MSTQVFLANINAAACDLWGSGVAVWNPNSAYYGTSVTRWLSRSLRLSRAGIGQTTAVGTTVASSTARHRFGIDATTPNHWVSPPLDRDVTIASTVTFNLWVRESSMNANVQMACRVERILGDGSLSATAVVAGATEGAEMSTTDRAENFTATPTSTAFQRGDRLLITPYWTNIGTQGGGHTITFAYGETTAGVLGDSYVTFTENFGFLQGTPTHSWETATPVAGGATFGQTTLARRGVQFRLPANCTIDSVTVTLRKSGSPADNVLVQIETDSSGAPSGTVLGSGSVSGASLTTSAVAYNIDLDDPTVSADTLYHLVVLRSGSLDSSNYYAVDVSLDLGIARPPWNIGVYRTYNAGWDGGTNGSFVNCSLTTISTTLYPTTTAAEVDPNGASYDAKEAWTSRGSGVTTAVTNTAAAPASPLLATVSAGGNFVEWFSKKLSTFTLAGVGLVNLRALESTDAANATLGVEIAITDADGTSPVVWGYTLYGLEVPISETASQFFVAGDDVVVTDGQRIRIRVYSDDSNDAAMAASLTTTAYYAGTSGGASGDTYLTFGQTLTQLIANAVMLPHQFDPIPFIPQGRSL